MQVPRCTVQPVVETVQGIDGELVLQLVQLMGEAVQVRELGDVAGEGVEQADGAVPVALQEEEAIGGVEDAVVLELREGDTDEGTGGGEVEEAGVAAVGAVAREPAEALREEHPAARVEARVQQGAAARGGSGGAPLGADRAEADVVYETPRGEHPRRDELRQVDVQRRPVRRRSRLAVPAIDEQGDALPRGPAAAAAIRPRLCSRERPNQDRGEEYKDQPRKREIK